MARRVFMWIAVVSLLGLGLTSAATWSAFLVSGGWTVYTPYPSRLQTLTMRLVEASGYIQMVLLPLAALSSAGYILLLDRDVRRGSTSRGFDIEAGK